MQHCLFGRLICEICDSGNGCFERICIKGSGCFDIRQFFLHGANYKCPWRKNRYQSRRFVPSSRWNISLPCVRSGWQRGVVKEVLWRKHRRCGPVPYTARGPALRMYIITGGSWQSRSDAWGNWLPTSYVLVMFFLANMVSKSIELCAQVVLSNGASIFVPLVTWPENLLNIFLVLHGHSRSPVHSKLAPCSGPVISCASHLKIFFEGIAMKNPAKPSKATTGSLMRGCQMRWRRSQWGKPDPAPRRRVTSRGSAEGTGDFNFDVLVLLRNRSNQTNWLLEWLLAALEVRKCAGRDEVFPLAEGRGTEGRGSMQLQN